MLQTVDNLPKTFEIGYEFDLWENCMTKENGCRRDPANSVMFTNSRDSIFTNVYETKL